MKEAIKNYEEAIKMMIEIEGCETTNIANHAALEKGIISLDQFRAGARILVKEYLRTH